MTISGMTIAEPQNQFQIRRLYIGKWDKATIQQGLSVSQIKEGCDRIKQGGIYIY
jgi:hypothetical protein